MAGDVDLRTLDHGEESRCTARQQVEGVGCGGCEVLLAALVGRGHVLGCEEPQQRQLVRGAELLGRLGEAVTLGPQLFYDVAAVERRLE